MASTDFLNSRALAKRGIVRSEGTDTPVAIRIRHKTADAVTSVTVTTATNLVLIDAAGTTTVTFATDTTLGAVVSRINATSAWEARVIDPLRSLASASTMVDGAISSSTWEGETYWDAKVDTSAALQICTCLSLDRHTFGSSHSKGKLFGQHRIKVLELQYGVNMGTAAVDSVQLWRRNIQTGIETQVLGLLSVDTTVTTVNWASGLVSIDSLDGEEMIALVKDAATLADATTNFVRLSGFSE